MTGCCVICEKPKAAESRMTGCCVICDKKCKASFHKEWNIVAHKECIRSHLINQYYIQHEWLPQWDKIIPHAILEGYIPHNHSKYTYNAFWRNSNEIVAKTKTVSFIKGAYAYIFNQKKLLYDDEVAAIDAIKAANKRIKDSINAKARREANRKPKEWLELPLAERRRLSLQKRINHFRERLLASKIITTRNATLETMIQIVQNMVPEQSIKSIIGDLFDYVVNPKTNEYKFYRFIDTIQRTKQKDKDDAIYAINKAKADKRIRKRQGPWC